MKSKKSKKNFNLKQKIKILNKRGFTLVELLAIIVITAVILGIGTYSVIHLVNNSKTGATRISVNSIKESASIYSDEDSSRWIEPYNDSYSYFCTTIGELINKGIIKKNATLPNGIDRDKYVSIKKNKVTLVKGEAVILASENNSSEEDENEKNKMSSICEGNNIIEPDAKKPNIKSANSYTDSLSVSFEDGKAPNSEIKDKWCQYDTKSSFDYTDFSFEDGKNVIVLDKAATNCVIGNLKNNSDYYVRVCMTTTGGSRLCDTSYYSTAEFKKPTISYKDLTSKITYDDAGIESGKANHYFKSNISAKSNVNIYECDYSFNCNGSATKNIDKDKWYKVSDKNVTIDYSSSDGIENGVITARIADGSNNSKKFKDEFSLYKIVFKVGSADSIDNKTSDISKMCIAERGKSCNIFSPSIKKDCYTGMGWSTSNNANSSSWSPGASKSISSSGTYYPTNGNKTTYTVSYNANGGSGAPSSQTKTCKVDLTLRSTKPSRSGYTFDGWSSSSNGSAGYYPGGIYKDDKNITLYAVWEKDVYSLSLSKNSGVSRIYYREGTSGSYTSSSGNVSINNITSGTKYYYYGTAYSGYEMNSCTSSSPCSVTVNSNVSRTLYASEIAVEDDTYMFTLNRGTGVDKMYYREGSSGSYTQSYGYSVLMTSIDYGTTYYYYGTASSGYTMDSCTSSSPCSVRITSDVTRTLSASSNSSGGSSGGGSSSVYGIYYQANGSNVTGLPSTQYKDPGVAITLSSNRPSRSGYTFKGWSTSSSGGVEYSPGDKYYNDQSVYMYAVWSSNSSGGSSTTTTYSCPSGYTCSSSSCNKYSTCTKTTYGTVTTKYYCSHNNLYQNSSTCSYVGGYYDDSYGLNCVESNCKYSCSSGTNGGNGYCYSDYYQSSSSSCPSGWTYVSTNSCRYTCGILVQGVSKEKECYVYGSCSSSSSLSCSVSGVTCSCSDKSTNSGCNRKTYYNKCSKPATKSGCSKTYSGGSYSGTTTTSGSCDSGYSKSKGSGCTTKIYKDGVGYCDTRQYWAGKSCTASMTTGATVRTDMNCSKTGDVSYYCSITGNYTTTKPNCSETTTTDPVSTPHS